ncbi:hypothetical protein GWK47_004152 [Chionoecetes opilio]|uniref:Tesmin/TSO1-like CXC domain-containing protein n=1 Tax=Chionoecetes opilio TaxID=41210 RepID=A0A8J5D296_CHIOP|nr:hypothetical protein GWK47_004152 [Chionoecetes opilio]
MSDIRYRHWISSMGIKSAASVHQLKTLPLTSEAFVENVKRAHFQACIWRSALTGEAPDMDPLENGWVSDDDFSVLMPVTLPPQTEIAPAAVMKLIQCGCSSETPCSTERCGCVAGQMSCSAFCRCRAEIRTFRNRWTLLKQRIEDANDSDEDESNDEDDKCNGRKARYIYNLTKQHRKVYESVYITNKKKNINKRRTGDIVSSGGGRSPSSRTFFDMTPFALIRTIFSRFISGCKSSKADGEKYSNPERRRRCWRFKAGLYEDLFKRLIYCAQDIKALE